MPQGTVKFFWIDKGYGLIAPDDRGKDVYVDRSELEKTGLMRLVPGERVTFDVESNLGTGKTRATNVHVV